ncbi:MAG: hypothetical protein LUF27_11805 [Lachnospiraceae bacterium]|nr:hypothetical protein [Lachnospiraceae bacterium]
MGWIRETFQAIWMWLAGSDAKEPAPEKKQEEEKTVAEVRGHRQALLAKVNGIQIQEGEKSLLKPEEVQEIRRRLEPLKEELGRLSSFDTPETDRKLEELLQGLGSCIQAGNMKACRWMLEGLEYGILRAKKPVKSEEEARDMEKRMDAYLAVSEKWKYIQCLRNSIRKREQQAAALKTEYNMRHREVEAYRKANPGYVEELEESAGVTEKLSAGAMKLANFQTEIRNMKNSCEEQEKMIALDYAVILETEAAIEKQRTVFFAADMPLLAAPDPEVQGDFLDAVSGKISWISEQERSGRTISRVIEAAFSSRSMKTYAMDAGKAWENMEMQEETEVLEEQAAREDRVLYTEPTLLEND